MKCLCGDELSRDHPCYCERESSRRLTARRMKQLYPERDAYGKNQGTGGVVLEGGTIR